MAMTDQAMLKAEWTIFSLQSDQMDWRHEKLTQSMRHCCSCPPNWTRQRALDDQLVLAVVQCGACTGLSGYSGSLEGIPRLVGSDYHGRERFGETH